MKRIAGAIAVAIILSAAGLGVALALGDEAADQQQGTVYSTTYTIQAVELSE